MSDFSKRLSQMTVKPISFGDSASVDAFGLARTTGKPGNRFDVEFIYNKQPELVDEITHGNGAATWNSASRDITLTTGGAAITDNAGLWGYDVPYTPGSSQLIEITGTLDNAGIGGGEARLFVRSTVSGSYVEQYFSQADWNISPENQTTLERPAVDWSKSQIFAMDFQSLKIGRIRFALVRNGVAVPVHQVFNDNLRATGYWQLPSLPPYWQIYNDATYSYTEMGYGDEANSIGLQYRLPLNGAASMRAICATVKSEGAVGLLEMPGYQRSIDNYTSTVTVGTSYIPILSIRVAATYGGQTNRGLYIPTGYSVIGDNPMFYAVIYRPTLTGANWQPVDPTNSGMEVDVSATAQSGGIQIDSDYLATTRNTASAAGGLLGRTLMRLTRTGTPDILTIAAIRTTSSSSSASAVFRWKEIR